MTGSAPKRDLSVWVLFGALIVFGAGWGLTIPMAKIAVMSGYRHFGIIFWQFVIGVAVLSVISLPRGTKLPWKRAHVRVYVIIALVGTLVPSIGSYEAARHLPAGWMSVVISMVPMIAFPIALIMGNERFNPMRLLGLAAGLAGVLVLVLPAAGIGSDAPADGRWVWVLVAVLAVSMYGFEGNYVAKWGTAGLSPVQVLWGASVVGTVLSLPLALMTGSFINPLPPYGIEDAALVLSSVLHVLVYTGYVWLVGRAGSVFAAQVAYLVTGFGVMWSMVILGESYGVGFWMAFVLMIVGMTLVRPRAVSVDNSAAVRHPVG
jgi:drug/metabolite transporter (DMT)-like permease